MEEKEINKILKPKKKLIILLIFCLSISFICIGLILFMKFTNNQSEESLDISEFVLNNNNQEKKYVKLYIDTLPILMVPTLQNDNNFYFVKDINNHVYIASLSNRTLINISENVNMETGNYELKGFTNPIDDEIKTLALANSYRIFKNNELTIDTFSEYLDEFYIQENIISDRLVTLYTISALVGVFFLILSLGYLVPTIIKVNKTFSDKKLVDELQTELENLTDTSYKKQHVFLTKNYMLYGIQPIKYDDIISAYIKDEKKYGITVGKNLFVIDKDNKKFIMASVAGSNNNVLDNILSDLKVKNPNIQIQSNNENNLQTL